jgi:hypothetical protein
LIFLAAIGVATAGAGAEGAIFAVGSSTGCFFALPILDYYEISNKWLA